MKIAFFDTHDFERTFFEKKNESFKHDITYFETRLTSQTAPLANDHDCICCFVNDVLDKTTLEMLEAKNLKLIALRSAGYNNIDLEGAYGLGLTVVRVPAYSPYAVAEHAAAMLLSLNRKIHKSYMRVRDLNFSLEGLVGFDLHGKTVGVMGTGKIGTIFAGIMRGFGCRVLAHDLTPNKELESDKNVHYVSLPELYKESDIISLHIPLTSETNHIIDFHSISQMKTGVVLINTGRGALIDTPALIEGLKTGRVGAAALDVYEEEEGIFFEDRSNEILQDDVLVRLILFPNVLITSHQAFLTREALESIAQTTLQNITDFEKGLSLENEVRPETHVKEKDRLNG